MTEEYQAALNDFLGEHPGMFLFKNRSGQWVYQVYSAETGKPETPETFYMVKGDPRDSVPGYDPKMPPAGTMGDCFGLRIFGMEYNPDAGKDKLQNDLETAFAALIAA